MLYSIFILHTTRDESLCKKPKCNNNNDHNTRSVHHPLCRQPNQIVKKCLS